MNHNDYFINILIFRAHDLSVHQIAFHSSGNFLITGSQDKFIKVNFDY